MSRVAVLFARSDSLYKQHPLCDVYDESRNALTWPGRSSAIAHPPCREWGRLRQFSKAPAGERELAIWAVWAVRASGGVLEHPAASSLWQFMGLPLPGKLPDAWGGYTIEIRQCDFGHPAEKLTWLYIVRRAAPPMPPHGTPTHVIKSSARDNPLTRLPICTHKWRDQTPPALIEWLVTCANNLPY